LNTPSSPPPRRNATLDPVTRRQIDQDHDSWIDRYEFLALYLYFHTGIPPWVRKEQHVAIEEQRRQFQKMVKQASVDVQDASAAVEKAMENEKVEGQSHEDQDGPLKDAMAHMHNMRVKQDGVRKEVAADKKKLEAREAEREHQARAHAAERQRIGAAFAAACAN